MGDESVNGSRVDAQAVIDELAETVRQQAVELATLRALLKQQTATNGEGTNGDRAE